MNTGTAEMPARRACASETECCGGLRLTAEDTANIAEFCFTATATAIDGSKEVDNGVNTWFATAEYKKMMTDGVTAAASADAWKTFSEGIAAVAKAADDKAVAGKGVFGCIEGAGNLAA